MGLFVANFELDRAKYNLEEAKNNLRQYLLRSYSRDDNPEETAEETFKYLSATMDSIFKRKQMKIDFEKIEAFVNGHEVKFTSKEFAILEYFINRDGKVIHRHELLNNIWGYDKTPTTRTVDTFVLEIRKKIEETPSKPKHIISVSGIGYRFVSGN